MEETFLSIAIKWVFNEFLKHNLPEGKGCPPSGEYIGPGINVVMRNSLKIERKPVPQPKFKMHTFNEGTKK